MRARPRPREIRPCDRRSSPPLCCSHSPRPPGHRRPRPPALRRNYRARRARSRELRRQNARRRGEDAAVGGRRQRSARVAAASLADVKPGVYVGVAAAPGDDGTLKALEVHIFPESMRGVGDGHRPFDLAPGSTMTNGAVNARVEQVDGPQIVVAYNGGQQTITVDKSTPIVAIEPGGLGDLMAGAAIVARG